MLVRLAINVLSIYAGHSVVYRNIYVAILSSILLKYNKNRYSTESCLLMNR